MAERVEYNVSFSISEELLDEEMNENINKIAKVTGWNKEVIIRSAFQFGCKWYLKDQLKFIVNYQLGKTE